MQESERQHIEVLLDRLSRQKEDLAQLPKDASEDEKTKLAGVIEITSTELAHDLNGLPPEILKKVVYILRGQLKAIVESEEPAKFEEIKQKILKALTSDS